LNNHHDQFSLYITPDGTRGYYSHEEVSGQVARGRIYTFQVPPANQPRQASSYVHGTVTDRRTGRPLKARVELFDLERNERVSAVESDSVTGSYLMVLTRGAEYALYVSCQGYAFQSMHFNYQQQQVAPLERHIQLDPITKGTAVVLNNIFFDTDSYVLKDKSITELRRVLQFLTENPQVKIEIQGHTDNTGTAAYNQQLSENRARAVYQFLIQAGIPATRLSAKGFGALHPVASNDTPEGRMQNRRIEFKVLE
jgi:outer membrane protein OmpA-like peptidoglycan-associated protein